MCLITINDSFRPVFMKLYNRHEDYLIQYITVFLDLFIRKSGFNNTLLNSSCFFQNSIYIFEVIIAFININKDLTFT